ncbi:hypothetical protein [Nocardioides sp. zg-DK7169]|uniref:hypothetical protein n=1 Tax=Nocardioides sp. zg-DK7169 TaxID=2736600 RepID=UPI001C131083|nr:hypothetical protein [Nocardioides sp. zg-DK7169]
MLKLLLVVVIFAAVTYLAARALQRSGQAPTLPRPRPRPQPPRIVAPDDDEEFLRDLERKRKRPHPKDPEGPAKPDPA